jgi:pentose-5-phosphate-3-epimerase
MLSQVTPSEIKQKNWFHGVMILHMLVEEAIMYINCHLQLTSPLQSISQVLEANADAVIRENTI